MGRLPTGETISGLTPGRARRNRISLISCVNSLFFLRISLLPWIGNLPLTFRNDWPNLDSKSGSSLRIEIIPVLFPVSREFSSGDWFACDCVRHQCFQFVAAGIDAERDDVTIAPVPNTGSSSVIFGLMAAKALEERLIDGFWANGLIAGSRRAVAATYRS